MRSWFLAAALALSGVGAAARPCPAAEPARYALLVGCTRYENQSPQLEGPGNDVVLMGDLLTSRYQFPRDNVVILSEASGKRPTRAHIEEEFHRLADRARPGDKVVILLAGHGCREPDTRPDDPEHFNTDGKEAIFLPCDAGARDDFDPKTGTLRNAIPDYQFREWLRAIRAKGASIWVIVDACHSAGLARDDRRGVVRAVPDVGPLPPEIRQMVEARIKGKAAPAPDDSRKARSPLKLAPDAPDLVAVYAAQATEPTIENRMPPDADDPPPVVHGLLTYTLCQVLTQARTPLTYTELVQRVQDLYAGWSPVFPTPLVEGKDQDRLVLGDDERPSRSRIRLLADPAGGWKVNAGSLAGLTAGTVLAVYPQAGDPGADKLLGYVEVARAGLRPLEAQVRPVAYQGVAAPRTLPERGRCEVAFLDYGDLRLKVAIDDRTGDGEPVPEGRRQGLRAALERLANEKGSIIATAASPREAEWLLRVDARSSDKVYLLPAGAALLARPGQPSAVFGPLPAESGELAGWLKDRLERVARAQRLLAFAADDRRALVSDDQPLKLGVQLVRVTTGGAELPIRDATAHPGDRLRVQVTNEGGSAADVTVLFVDSKYGITPLFPRSKTDNRILPGDSLRASGDLGLDAEDVGREHVVVIAARARPQQEYANFTFLAQPNLARSRDEARAGSRATQDVFNSPFGKLLQQAFYGDGARGEPAEAAGECAFAHVSWQVAPGKRPASEQP
jgi:hypothetical protein